MLNNIILFLSVIFAGSGALLLVVCCINFYLYMIEDERRYQRTRIIMNEMEKGKNMNEAAKIADVFDDDYRKDYKWFYENDRFAK